MKSFLKNYKQTLILLAAIIIGAIVGLCCAEKATVLNPLGDIFINLIGLIIVPLIFLTISTSISKISQPEKIGKILGTIVLVFIITSLISVLFSFLLIIILRFTKNYLVRPRGFEPPASPLGGERSIQLSYERVTQKL